MLPLIDSLELSLANLKVDLYLISSYLALSISRKMFSCKGAISSFVDLSGGDSFVEMSEVFDIPRLVASVVFVIALMRDLMLWSTAISFLFD